jgi:hypothetical protein
MMSVYFMSRLDSIFNVVYHFHSKIFEDIGEDCNVISEVSKSGPYFVFIFVLNKGLSALLKCSAFLHLS